MQLFAIGSNGGVDALFASGHVYFSSDGTNLDGYVAGGNLPGGSTVNAYTGSETVTEMVAYEGGMLTLFSRHGLYFSPDGQNLGGGNAGGSVGTEGIAYGVQGFYIEGGDFDCAIVIIY